MDECSGRRGSRSTDPQTALPSSSGVDVSGGSWGGKGQDSVLSLLAFNFEHSLLHPSQ